MATVATRADGDTIVQAWFNDIKTVLASEKVTTKGDLVAATAAFEITRVAIGAIDGDVLKVDASEATGMKWDADLGKTALALAMMG